MAIRSTKKIIEIGEDEIRLAGIAYNSLVNGEGMRMVIFSQGCYHHCDECFNPETWDFNKGKIFKIKEIEDKVINNEPLIDGITFSGGDPIEQASRFKQIAKFIKEQTKLTIWLYTGYTWEQLVDKCKNDKNVLSLISCVDVIMDGRFDKNKMTSESSNPSNFPYRGSTNQRSIDVQKSLKQKKLVLYKIPQIN